MANLQSRIFDSCNLLADYGEEASRPALPFIITLNLTASRLTPAAGENQRFCYDVTGAGASGPDTADLSQLVLGLGEDIVPEDVAAITVFINGEEQEVEFGPDGNVALRTAEAPDPVSGCTGLAVYFPLSREDGQLQLCFELTEPRSVGPVPVCVSGGGISLDGLDICGPVEAAPVPAVTAYYRAQVCAPVRLTPGAAVGTPQVTPCGEPEIVPGNACGAEEGGADGGFCGFTVRQQLCVSVPLEFGVTAEAGEVSTECLAAGGEEACADCGEEPPAESDIISRPGYCG